MTNSKPLLNIVQDIMYLLTLNGNTSEYQTKAKELNPDELQVLKTIKAKQAKQQHKTKCKQNKPVKDEVEKLPDLKGLAFDMANLTAIGDTGWNYLLFTKQRAGADFSVKLTNLSETVRESLLEAELDEEFTLG